MYNMDKKDTDLLEEPPMPSERSEEKPEDNVRKTARDFLAVAEEARTRRKNSPKTPTELPSETPKENVNLEKLKGQIDGAQSIEGLCEVLNSAPELANSSENVVKNIRDVESFLEKNMDEIVTGVINKGAKYYRELLGEKLRAIEAGGELAIQKKVKELLKARMDESFKEKKAEYVVEAVARCNSFEQLYEVIKQFKGVNIDKVDELKYSSGQAIKVIETTRHDFNVIIDDPKVLNGPSEVINKNIEDLIKNVPKDSGINNKVRHLLIKRLKEARLESFSSDSQKSFGSGIFAKAKKFFGRR